MFLALLLSALFSSITVWKILSITSCQRGSIELNDMSLHGPAKLRCFQLEITSQQAAS